MSTVSQLLRQKGSTVCSVSPNAFAYDALRIMADQNIGALIVLEDDKIVGIFSERDYARKVILEGKSSKNTPVGDLMSTNVLYIKPDTTIEKCMVLMTDKHVRHLPVLNKDKLVGIISIGDVVNKIICDQRTAIGEFENYISGRMYGSQ